MRNTIAGIRRHYGANPLNLLVLLGCFALAGYAVTHVVADPTLPRILLWFAAALIAHDLILFPLYALADRSLTGALTRIRVRGRRTTTSFVSLRNHIRIPALGSALLLVVYLPGIIRQGQATYLAATGQTQQPYLDRWLLLTAALFTLSAISYAIRLARSPRPIRPTPPTEHPAPPDIAPTERAPTGALPTAGLLVLVLATLIFRILRHLRSNPNTHRPTPTTPKMVAPQRSGVADGVAVSCSTGRPSRPRSSDADQESLPGERLPAVIAKASLRRRDTVARHGEREIPGGSCPHTASVVKPARSRRMTC